MAKANKKSTAVVRLNQDYIRLVKDPVPYIVAEPLPSNVFVWYYVILGPADSPYAGGYYLGKLLFPKEYPFRPPAIYMITPNGRFATNTRLCLSISDFHPDTWNPAWSVSSILTGLLSFMLENATTAGSISTSSSAKKALARASLEFNVKNDIFCQLFPDLHQQFQSELATRASACAGDSRGSADQLSDEDNSPEYHENVNQLSFSFVVILFAVLAILVKLVMSFLATDN